MLRNFIDHLLKLLLNVPSLSEHFGLRYNRMFTHVHTWKLPSAQSDPLAAEQLQCSSWGLGVLLKGASAMETRARSAFSLSLLRFDLLLWESNQPASLIS